MHLILKGKNLYTGILGGEKNEKSAYNIWASTYDGQPGNLMLDLEEKIVTGFLEQIDLTGKTIVINDKTV